MLYSKEETKKRESKVLNSYKTFMMMVQEEIVVLENHSFSNIDQLSSCKITSVVSQIIYFRHFLFFMAKFEFQKFLFTNS